LRGIADDAVRRTKATSLRTVITTLQSAQQSAQSADWAGKSPAAFVTALHPIFADVQLLATGLDAQADALTAYAGQVQQIKDAQAALQAQRTTAHERLSGLNRQFDAAYRQAQGPYVTDQEAAKQADRIGNKIGDEQAVLRGIDRQWEDLVTRRRAADAACAAALQSGDVLGATAPFTAAAIKSDSPETLLAMLGALSATDLQILLKAHPELVGKVLQADPDKVKSWWDSLAADGNPAEQDALIAGAPAIIGAFGGIPPLVRVAANKINAAARIQRDETVIKSLKNVSSQMNLIAGSHVDGYEATIAALKKEIKFLKGAVGENPTVQLYLYDPDHSRIIQILGTPSADTSHVITYVPGTFTNIDSFYDKSSQQFAAQLLTGYPDAVAFVYKDGVFPGGDDGTDAINYARIGEANDPARALAAGRQLAQFEQGLSTDPTLAAAQSTAIGHSWGLTNITSSEISGAHYNQVISLSGAGMPAGWEASPSTSYTDYSYYDILQEAQGLGLVWGGDVPRADPAFTHGPYYQGPVDPIEYGPFGAPDGVDQGVLLNNHNLIATNTPANAKVLKDVIREVYQ
jgi:hypothetical protein